MASTETGVIFGNIIWESGTTESCVILSDVHIDIMDYIKPAYCNEAQVRGVVLCGLFQRCLIGHVVPKYVDGVRMGEQS